MFKTKVVRKIAVPILTHESKFKTLIERDKIMENAAEIEAKIRRDNISNSTFERRAHV